MLLEVRPDSLAVIAPMRDPVVFVFDERLSERGAEDVAFVSPRTSAIQVSRRGNELRVGLRGGWEPGQIYHVTIRPTLQDLFNNRITQPIHHVFSTGPEIPETYLAGTVIDRITGQPELDVRVEAIRRPDSLVYAVPTDSAGNFTLGRIPQGDYAVRAYRDLNRDRSLDPFEPRDTTAAAVVTGDSVRVELSLVMPDTTPPAVASARVASGGLIEVVFDDHLDPVQAIAPVQVRIFTAEMREIRVARVAVGQLAPRAPEPTVPGDEPLIPERPMPVRPPAAAGPADGRQLPSQTLVVETAEPLEAGVEYRIVIEAVRNLVGLMGGGEATFTAPDTPAAPPAPAPPPPAPPAVEEPPEPDEPPGG